MILLAAYFVGPWVFFALAAFVADHLAEAREDEDLEWVDEQIRRVEEGPRVAVDNPDMQRARREYLERLRQVRARLLGEVS